MYKELMYKEGQQNKCIVQGMKDLSYEERLRILKLLTLKHMRLSGNMIQVYRFPHNEYDTDVAKYFLHFSENKRTIFS